MSRSPAVIRRPLLGKLPQNVPVLAHHFFRDLELSRELRVVRGQLDSPRPAKLAARLTHASSFSISLFRETRFSPASALAFTFSMRLKLRDTSR